MHCLLASSSKVRSNIHRTANDVSKLIYRFTRYKRKEFSPFLKHIDSIAKKSHINTMTIYILLYLYIKLKKGFNGPLIK